MIFDNILSIRFTCLTLIGMLKKYTEKKQKFTIEFDIFAIS